jgi:hypothetical protein
MYDTRWPRPGPVMAAVAAVVGLIAGVILGFSAPGSGSAAQAGAASKTSTRPPATTVLEEFQTVILGSFDDLDHADAAMRRFRQAGVDDAGVLKQADYSSLGTAYAVYSGRFQTESDAEAHKVELAQLGITEAYLKSVTR